MDKITPNDIDWLLKLHERKHGQRTSTPSAGKKWMLNILLGVSGTIALVLLPFLLLIRTAVFFSAEYGWPGWFALGMGMTVAIGLLVIYLLLAFRQIKNKKFVLRYMVLGCTIMVLSFCLYATFYISAVHVKNENVRNVYRSMHPVLRVAMATTTLADGSLVITDIKRRPIDYEHMGLPPYERSLHYVQSTGYVHAVDIRTLHRHEIRNAFIRLAFKLMGFKTIRHVGTADHLHVSLPV